MNEIQARTCHCAPRDPFLQRLFGLLRGRKAMSADERYLARAVDIHDLEVRQRQLEHAGS